MSGLSIQSESGKPTLLRVAVRSAVKNHLEACEKSKPSVQVNDLYRTVLHEIEVSVIDILLQHTRGNQTQTAHMLGINRGTLRAKINQHMGVSRKKSLA